MGLKVNINLSFFSDSTQSNSFLKKNQNFFTIILRFLGKI